VFSYFYTDSVSFKGMIIKDVRSEGVIQCGHFMDKDGSSDADDRTSAFYGAKNLRFFEICCLSVWTKRLSQCGQGRGASFRDFVRTSFTDGPKTNHFKLIETKFKLCLEPRRCRQSHAFLSSELQASVPIKHQINGFRKIFHLFWNEVEMRHLDLRKRIYFCQDCYQPIVVLSQPSLILAWNRYRNLWLLENFHRWGYNKSFFVNNNEC